jgi:hypothetical protein
MAGIRQTPFGTTKPQDRAQERFFGYFNIRTDVFTVAPTGKVLVGWGRPFAATAQSPVADGQYTQPLLLQMSISPLSFTDHSLRSQCYRCRRRPVRASMARAGVAAVTISIAAKVKTARWTVARKAEWIMAFPP